VFESNFGKAKLVQLSYDLLQTQAHLFSSKYGLSIVQSAIDLSHSQLQLSGWNYG
jgi:hypothetical protein